MPQPLSFPGVYIEEVPSGVRTIVGVPTSIVAFVGRTRKGTPLQPTTIFSFQDFEREFGGLWPESSLGYAVRDFYLNAPGSQAIIVSVEPANGKRETVASLKVDNIELVAREPGTAGNTFEAKLDHDALIPLVNAADERLFNLAITGKDAKGKDFTEVFRNVSTDIANPRRFDAVLEASSSRVRAKAQMTVSLDRPKVSSGVNTKGVNANGALTDQDIAKGLNALSKVDASGRTETFNILCIPPLKGPEQEEADGLPTALIDLAAGLCERSRAMLLIDPPKAWDSTAKVIDGLEKIGQPTKAAALYFPRISKPESTIGGKEFSFAPCGAVAGVFARTDGERGVWKAPAGLDAVLRGAPKLSVSLSDQENGRLNPLGVNCLRVKTGPARVVWGARTRVGSDESASEWKYVPIRRLANFIEETLFRNTQWVVFEPNDEPLWGSIRLNVGSFMHGLFRQGAFQGGSPRDAYFVKCDKDTNPQAAIDSGIVNIVVGFAPLKPAEFVVIKLQQIAGAIET